MNIVTFPSMQTTFQQITTFILEKKGEWLGHIVTKVKVGLTYLEDPRLASIALFFVNFGILELASRVSRLVGLCLSKQTTAQKDIKFAFELTLTSALVILGNMAFIKVANISLNPYVVVPIVVVTFMIKQSLENYLEQPISADNL
jgi:hypothetical protein